MGNSTARADRSVTVTPIRASRSTTTFPSGAAEVHVKVFVLAKHEVDANRCPGFAKRAASHR